MIRAADIYRGPLCRAPGLPSEGSRPSDRREGVMEQATGQAAEPLEKHSSPECALRRSPPGYCCTSVLCCRGAWSRQLLPCAWPRAAVSHYLCEIGVAAILTGGETEALERPQLDRSRAAGAASLRADRQLPSKDSELPESGWGRPQVVVSSGDGDVNRANEPLSPLPSNEGLGVWSLHCFGFWVFQSQSLLLGSWLGGALWGWESLG